MRAKLTDAILNNWLKLKSLPFAAALLFIGYWVYVLNISTKDEVPSFFPEPNVVAWFCVLLWVVYFVACLFHNRLPSTPKGYLSVLFCIDAESEKLFTTAKSKLVNEFETFSGKGNTKFKALCISKSRIARLDLRESSDVLRLLGRTGSVILVQVHYSTDDVDCSEDFELRIDYGVRHPQFNKTASMALSHDLSQLGASFHRQRFVKAETIDTFNFTTQTLVCACQYIVGFVYLLTGNGSQSADLLSQAKTTALANRGSSKELISLVPLIDDRLYAAYNRVAIENIEHFQKDGSLEHLQKACQSLEKANSIHPDTYSYNLHMAYVHVIMNEDIAAAKECVKKCKKSAQDKIWTYSDAFLAAYQGLEPGTIINRYKRAFSEVSYNLVEIVDYIERVIELEPDKVSLHLAAGLVYEQLEDSKLAKQHLAFYLANTTHVKTRIEEKLKDKMQSLICNTGCNQKCCECMQLATG